MEFKDILAISSMPGLYQSLGERPDGLLVQRLGEEKVRFVSNRIHVFSPLDKIGIYVTDVEEDNVALDKVMRSILQAETEQNLSLPTSKKASNKELRTFLRTILPNFDEERVYVSDIKKLIKWYLIVKELAADALNEPEVVEEEDAEIIYEKDLRLPHLVNVGKLHSPHNPTNEKRFVVTMALSDLNGKRLLWDEAVEKLSNNIV